jgi:hypothetical protein
VFWGGHDAVLVDHRNDGSTDDNPNHVCSEPDVSLVSFGYVEQPSSACAAAPRGRRSPGGSPSPSSRFPLPPLSGFRPVGPSLPSIMSRPLKPPGADQSRAPSLSVRTCAAEFSDPSGSRVEILEVAIRNRTGGRRLLQITLGPLLPVWRG